MNEKMKDQLTDSGWRFSKLLDCWKNKKYPNHSVKELGGLLTLIQYTNFDSVKELNHHLED